MYIFDGDFYFIRHGETEYNVKGIITGTMDIPLNNNGIIQAEKAKNTVAKLGIQTCFCSSSIRAVQTAEILLGSDHKLIKLEQLKEHDWGTLTGTLKSELDNKNFNDHNVEPWDNFSTRTITAILNEVVTRPVAIVAHSGTFRVLTRYLKINKPKEPVLNAWPYLFFKKEGVWDYKPVK